MNWLKRLLTKPPQQSIMERLEGLIPPVEKIRDSYKVDQRIAEEIHKEMVAIEERMTKSLEQQRQNIKVSELLIEQQEITSDIIETQYYKSLDAETIIINLREWLLSDDKTIAWILENVFIPAFVNGFAMQSEKRQRVLFNGLSVAVNLLKRLDGVLLDPE